MPTFPTYDANQNIQVRQVAPERHLASQPFQDLKQVENTVADIGQKLSYANDVMQETKAKTNVENALVQQELAAQNDPNPDNAELHIKAINDITKDATKGISNQELAGRVGLEINHSAFLSQIKVQDLFKKKQMIANDLKLDQLATTTAFNKSNAVSEAAGQQDEDNFMTTIKNNVNSGLITPERGLGLIKQYKLGVVKNDILKDPATNLADSSVYKAINEGKYKDLDLVETEKAVNMVKAKIKENKEIQINQLTNDRVGVIKSVATGELSWKNPDFIDKVMLKDPTLGESLQNIVKADANGIQYHSHNQQDRTFGELVTRIFNTKTKEELSDYIPSLLQENANRNISKDRLSLLINAAEQRAQSLSTNKESGNEKPSDHQNAIQNAIKSIKDFFSGKKDSTEKSGTVTHDLFKNMSTGASPQDAHKEAMKSFNVREYPWIASLPKEGAIKVDKNGNKVRIYPDGHYEEVK